MKNLFKLINTLALIIKKVVGYEGCITWDIKMPDGTPKKLLDSSLIFSMGWKPTIDLVSGVQKTYNWFLKNPINY